MTESVACAVTELWPCFGLHHRAGESNAPQIRGRLVRRRVCKLLKFDPIVLSVQRNHAWRDNAPVVSPRFDALIVCVPPLRGAIATFRVDPAITMKAPAAVATEDPE